MMVSGFGVRYDELTVGLSGGGSVIALNDYRGTYGLIDGALVMWFNDLR